MCYNNTAVCGSISSADENAGLCKIACDCSGAVTGFAMPEG